MNKGIKIIKPRVEFLGETPTDNVGMKKRMELFARLCYKSKIENDTYKVIPEKMYDSGHWAMLEHSNICLIFDYASILDLITLTMFDTRAFAYHNMVKLDDSKIYVAGNITAWLNLVNMLIKDVDDVDKRVYYANNILTSLYDKPLFKKHKDSILNEFNPTSLKHENALKQLRSESYDYYELEDNIPEKLKRYSFLVRTNRAITHEIVRHRVLSYAQESSRWIRYINKFGYLMFTPTFESLDDENIKKGVYGIYSSINEKTIELEKNGVKNDVIRGMYPNDLTASIGITGDKEGFKHFNKLRRPKDAHFQIQYIGNEFNKHLFEGN